MIPDMTYCSGVRCDRAKSCERWLHNLLSRLKRQGVDLEGKSISVAQFADYDGRCRKFVPINVPWAVRPELVGKL
jgi:hypothetical protein